MSLFLMDKLSGACFSCLLFNLKKFLFVHLFVFCITFFYCSYVKSYLRTAVKKWALKQSSQPDCLSSVHYCKDRFHIHNSFFQIADRLNDWLIDWWFVCSIWKDMPTNAISAIALRVGNTVRPKKWLARGKKITV